MADNHFDHQRKWWDSTSRNRFEGGPPSSTTTSSTGILQSWNNSTSSIDSNSVSAGPSHVIFQDESSGGGVLISDDQHTNLQMMMGLGLNSQPMDWNQHTLLRGVKGEGSFGSSFVQEDQQINMNPTTNFHQQAGSTNNPSNFQMDHQNTASSSIYESSIPSPSTILQGFFVPNQQQQHQQQQQHESSFENQNRSMEYPNYLVNYDVINPNNDQVLLPTKFSHFIGNSSGGTNSNSPPKQQDQLPSQFSQLHFSNNGPFWNASAPTAPAATTSMPDHVIPMSFLPSTLQQHAQYSMPPGFDEKSIKPNNLDANKSSNLSVKKSNSETSMKRPRNEATSSSPLPAPFKVKREKTTDKVTALQQLVLPFGKTDQASVFTAAIDCINYHHDQLAVLFTPFMKSVASNQHHHISHQSKDLEGQKQDLRSRGLCLVPTSTISHLVQETTVDFWTPTYGGTYR